MILVKTPTLGMIELTGIGATPTQKDYEATMKTLSIKADLRGAKIIVASLTIDQKGGIDFLLKNNFIQTSKPKRNPNSGNMILLLVKFI